MHHNSEFLSFSITKMLIYLFLTSSFEFLSLFRHSIIQIQASSLSLSLKCEDFQIQKPFPDPIEINPNPYHILIPQILVSYLKFQAQKTNKRTK